MLSYHDTLPHRPRRALIAGVTGVGKSTLGRTLGQLWGIPYTEIDSLHHGPNWTKRASFEEDVARLAGSESWITEWQYWGHGTSHPTPGETLVGRPRQLCPRILGPLPYLIQW